MNSINICGDVWVPVNSGFVFPPEFSRDLVFNLEGAITTDGTPTAGKICLRHDADALLKAFGDTKPLAACLANNHVMDYGEQGLRDTLEVLAKWGVPAYGAGHLEAGCGNPIYIDRGANCVALMGYVCESAHPILATESQPGVASLELERIRRDVGIARAGGADRIIVSIHWGEEEVWYPKASDVSIAGKILEMGVDLIVGHHAHCNQPWATTGEKSVFFGLGNAFFPDFEYQLGGQQVAWSKQRSWNRTCTLVAYDPDAQEVVASLWKQLDSGMEKLSARRLEMIELSLTPEALARHQAKYMRARRLAFGRLALSRFLARPRIPSLASLKHIVGEVFSRRNR